MRIWHKLLIPYLGRQQLLGQYRECCCIAKNLATNGTPNHLLVNKILDYPIEHFITYTQLVIDEMKNRGYKVSDESIDTFNYNINLYKPISSTSFMLPRNIFPQWHTLRYLHQCLMNLSEKYDCGGISEQEWNVILNKFDDELSEWYKEGK